ncbi:MAG: DNA alkylation repair protein [Patescibacteria group bacterium]
MKKEKNKGKETQCEQILKKLKSYSNQKNIIGMARFGINVKNVFGVTIPVIRKLAKEIGKNHKLALELWDSEIHEAKILASIIDEPKLVSEKQLEKWVKDFDSWDVCDQVCANLFEYAPFAFKKVVEWTKRKEEFVKRAGFAMMACLAVHDKKAGDEKFIAFFKYIKKESIDERNFVKKAINWALRQIGKRNIILNKLTINLAEEIFKIESKSAMWIAKDAIRELKSNAVQKRLFKNPLAPHFLSSP